MIEIEEIHGRLQDYIRNNGRPDARITRPELLMGGHAGLTFKFMVADDRKDEFILKLAPVGVKRQGNTDVYRQARLLRTLGTQHIPVPGVVWASPSDKEIGTAFVIMERLEGEPFIVWEPSSVFVADPRMSRSCWYQAARWLGEVHKLEWENVLAEWDAPRSARSEVDKWRALLRHAEKTHWQDVGKEIAQQLDSIGPPRSPIGLIHGDYQPGNILYSSNGNVSGIIDWELSFIGSVGFDLGWLLMMADGKAWSDTWQPYAQVEKKRLLDIYRDSYGGDDYDAEWYEAFACYKMAVIAAMNLKLHKTGRRIDDFWERFESSIDTLFDHAVNLLR